MTTRTTTTGRRQAMRLAALAAIGAAGAAGWAASRGLFSPDGRGRSFSVRGDERRPVLDPLRFRGAGAIAAYAAAQRHPEVLDQVYCYCQCDRPPFLHKSLLSCFTEDHGAS